MGDAGAPQQLRQLAEASVLEDPQPEKVHGGAEDGEQEELDGAAGTTPAVLRSRPFPQSRRKRGAGI